MNIHDTALKTGPFCRTCRYHRKQGQSFMSDQLFPRGFCPHAYRAIYPYALALLYNAQYPANGKGVRKVRVRCPGGGRYIEMDISIEYLYPGVLRMLKNAAILFLHKVNIAAEYPDKNVIIEVCDVKGNCRFDVAKGLRFKFNLFNRAELCPASFYALYPVLVSSCGRETGHPQASAHCPDPSGVFYNIENRSFSCEDFLKKIKNAVEEEPVECRDKENTEKKYRYDEQICPLAFYAAFPYYWTYVHAGKFDWVKKNERVSVQCVHPGGIIMEIELIRFDGLGDGAIKAEIIKTGNDCAYGYRKGDSFVLDSSKQRTRYELLINGIAVSAVFEKTNDLPRPGVGAVPAGMGEKSHE